MKMEDFTSPNLQLILGVKEGTNFDRVQKPTVIIATLNGHCLETKKILPDCNPQYQSDLIWETDKAAIRKMRCNQTPIKIECYAVNDNASREKLGYILLSVRCAQIIPKDKESNIKTSWYTILGVRNDFNNCKPQLLLYLIIKEKEESKLTITNDEQLNQTKIAHSDIVPIWLQEEHLIQLGPLELCPDIFTLSIIGEYTTNLDQLLKDLKKNYDNEFTFVYNVLDTSIRLKPFRPESDKIFLNEKIVIRIRTSLPILINFLNSKSHCFVRLKCNNTIIGQSEVDLRSLIPVNSLQEFKQIYKSLSVMEQYCILKSPTSKENRGDYKRADGNDKLPSLKICIKFQYLESKDIHERNAPYCPYSPCLQLIKNNAIPLSSQYNYVEEQNSESNVNKIPCISSWERLNHALRDTQIQNIKSTTQNILHQNKEVSNKTEDIYRGYCLNICLNAIKFLDAKPDLKQIEFRFYHLQGEMINAICNKVSVVAEQLIRLQDVKCKLHFISTHDSIEQLLTNFAPKINICDATSDEIKCIAQISLDIKMLFSNEKSECRYEALLTDCHNQQEIGYLDIFINLVDYTMSTSNEIKGENSKNVLDNSLAYKIVDELETWKERQKEIFKDELRKKEEAHLSLLNEEWQRRRGCLESKLTCSVQQCQILINNLNKSIEDLRLRKIQSLEKETKLIQANEELQWKYDRKLRQLQEALQKMQEEFSTKLMSLEEQNRNLLSQIEILNEKKCELEKINSKNAEQLEIHKKASLTEDQTATVLQQLKNLEEKLDNAQKSKSFFKEQWGKAVKEIHRIKLENQQTLESQIKNSKEEINNLDLEEILHADSAALTYDQIALNEIQREIDIMNPESAMSHYKSNNEQLFIPQSDLCLNLEQNPVKSDLSTSSSASDRRLHMLIEERDTLLKTGSYTSEDMIIIKLNAEIRSILMNS